MRVFAASWNMLSIFVGVRNAARSAKQNRSQYDSFRHIWWSDVAKSRGELSQLVNERVRVQHSLARGLMKKFA
jgi:hypothetical protein